MDDSPRGRWIGPVLLAWLAAALLAAVNVWFGPLNQDEGWYLLAAQNLSRGMMPYRDFLYTQGPVLPWVYGVFADVWSPGGVLGGRIFTAVLGFAAAFNFSAVACLLARLRGRAAAPPAGFLAFVLIALSPDWSYFTAIPKTYALASFFLSGGFLLLAPPVALPLGRGRTLFVGRVSPAAAGACFALAAATRATLCLAAVPVWISLIVVARRDRARRLDWLWFALGCAAALALEYAPFLALCPDNFLFSQTYHAARASAPFGQWLVLRAGFVCFLAQGYPALIAAAAILAATGSHGRMVAWSHGRSTGPSDHRTIGPSDHQTIGPSDHQTIGPSDHQTIGPSDHQTIRPSDPLYWTVVAAFVLLTLAHFLVPFPYNDYNTPAMPLAAVALAVPLGRLVVRAELRPWRVGLVALVASLAFVAASPWPMKWVDGEQRLFWFHSTLDSPLARLRRAGRAVREQNPEGKPILAQDAYLAVEAGVPVVPGFEMGPFSVFPDLSDAEARAHRVHNLATAEKAIRTCDADLAAVSGFTFAIACPSTDPLPEADRERLLSAVRERFGEAVYAEPRFGQHGTRLDLCARWGARERDAAAAKENTQP